MTHRALADLQRDWDELGSLDPLWAILSDKSRRYGGWDLDEFLATGEHDIGELMERAESLGRPVRRERALDFGCGVGRLTRAMAARFDEAIGVDISIAMIDRARRLHADVSNCSFILNERPDLSQFVDESFDLVYTDIVLQHLPDRATVETYISELVRVARTGGLVVFQVPASIPLRHRLQLRPRLYHALRRAGLRSAQVYGRLGLHPIRMIDLPQPRAVSTVERAGGRILAIDRERIGATSMEDATYYVTR